MLGRTETRTRDRMYFQIIWSVRDISRDDRARIATCRLRTPTDRHKENYSIDTLSLSCYFTWFKTGQSVTPLLHLERVTVMSCLINYCGFSHDYRFSFTRTFAINRSWSCHNLLHTFFGNICCTLPSLATHYCNLCGSNAYSPTGDVQVYERRFGSEIWY